MRLNQLFSLKGKTAVVTGGAGYLGAAISEALAEAGANVFIVSRNEERCKELAKDLQKKSIGYLAGKFIDISNQNLINSCFQEIYESTNSLDILVNNASFGSQGEIEKTPEEEWMYGIDGTINGVFRCTKGILPFMINQKSGVIINICSMYGVVSPNPEIYGESGFNNPANYGCGKAAIIQFTKYLACHYGEKGIRANAISPGAFPNVEVQENHKFIEQLKNSNPLGRIGKPDDLKGITIFLASQAAEYVTGQNICIDGGWTSW